MTEAQKGKAKKKQKDKEIFGSKSVTKKNTFVPMFRKTPPKLA